MLSLRCFRFYRPNPSATLVTALVEIPYLLLEQPGAGGELRYGIGVRITDQTGKQLDGQDWSGRANSRLRVAGAVSLETLDFSLQPGNYRVEVTVTDSVSGRQYNTGADITAWQQAPSASDLVLSPEMRIATGRDTMPRVGERRWGNTLVTSTTRLRLTPDRSKAFYLVEAYSETGDSGTMQVRVVDGDGTALITTRATPIRVAADGAILKGQLDLAGLPAGSYTLTVVIDLGGRKEERSDQFVMADFEESLRREGERLAAVKQTDEGFFGTMNSDQLDVAEAPLILMASPESLAVYQTTLSLKAKREFLSRFWQSRDPSPGTLRNEMREAFYSGVEEANKRYTPSGRNPAPGWRTDRGRIFVRYGQPGDELDRRNPDGTAPPYQVWRYQRGRDLYYIFADRTGFGAYNLLATNDLRETARPGYREILGGQALQDISRWLGIDLFGEASER
ncbi:MAG: GWxTD domain-containing protein [Gemmatimonadales bacterium]